MQNELETVEPSSSEPKEKLKPGPKKKTGPSEVEVLRDIIERLTKCLEKVATHTGQANYLAEFGFKRYDPTKQDMQKYKN